MHQKFNGFGAREESDDHCDRQDKRLFVSLDVHQLRAKVTSNTCCCLENVGENSVSDSAAVLVPVRTVLLPALRFIPQAAMNQ